MRSKTWRATTATWRMRWRSCWGRRRVRCSCRTSCTWSPLPTPTRSCTRPPACATRARVCWPPPRRPSQGASFIPFFVSIICCHDVQACPGFSPTARLGTIVHSCDSISFYPPSSVAHTRAAIVLAGLFPPQLQPTKPHECCVRESVCLQGCASNAAFQRALILFPLDTSIGAGDGTTACGHCTAADPSLRTWARGCSTCAASPTPSSRLWFCEKVEDRQA